MNLTTENILLIGSILLFISVIAGKTSYRFGVPVLILFLSIGMLAGSEGLGGIYFDDPKIAQFIGIVSLNFILFSGGLDTSWKAVKPVLKKGIALSTFGVLITALAVGIFVFLITDLTFYESMLLGSIVSSTDAAAVFSVMRSKSLGLKSNLRPALELESGSNDPMAYVLTIAFLSLVVNQEMSFWAVIPVFLQQMIIGGLLGFLFGWMSKWVINRIRLDFEGLYPVLTIALMFVTFSATDVAGGNGFLAIYICSVYLGNHDIMHKKTILKVYDGLAWLMQIVLFLTLGLLVFPSHILPVVGIGLLVSAILIFVARPLAVWISTIPFRMKPAERVYLSWAGLRGAVPIVFATYPLLAGVEKSELIFNIVFFVSVTSVLIQGTTLTSFAHLVGVALPEDQRPMSPTEEFLEEHPRTAMEEILIEPGNSVVGKMIVEIAFPKTAIIAMIKRGEQYITPNGATEIKENDILIILSDSAEGLEDVKECLCLNQADLGKQG